MTELVPTTLTTEEVELLAECERTIARGLKVFIETGTALTTVRDSRLYRTEYATFEAYCQARWGFTDRRARQLMDAAAIGRILPVANAGQAAELARVPEEQRADVWQATVEATGGKPTAAKIRETYERPQTPASTPEPAPATDVDPSARATTPADAQPADDPTTPGADGQADTVFRGTDQAGEQRGPAVELPSPPVRPKPTVDPIDDPEFIKQQRREISTDAVAAALVAIGMQLESDPVRWLNEMWIPGRYRLRDLPRVRDCFTPDGLRTSAKSLELLADHLDATGGSL